MEQPQFNEHCCIICGKPASSAEKLAEVSKGLSSLIEYSTCCEKPELDVYLRQKQENEEKVINSNKNVCPDPVYCEIVWVCVYYMCKYMLVGIRACLCRPIFWERIKKYSINFI